MKKMYVCYLYHYAIKKPMFTQAAILSKKTKKILQRKWEMQIPVIYPRIG